MPGSVMLRACVGVLCAASLALAGEPAKVEKSQTPLEQAKRLATSKDQGERAQAFQWLKSLAKPGTAQGDEACLHYAEFCLRLHEEGVKGMLEEAKKAFTELKEGSHSRWGIWGKLGLWRVDALEGSMAVKDGCDWECWDRQVAA